MDKHTTTLRVASVIFALIALGHLARLLKHAQVIVGSHTIPLWFSIAGAIVAALLSLWMWMSSK